MAKKVEKKEEVILSKAKATLSDFDVIIEPLITEKSMSLSQEQNKATFIVKDNANKVAIKNAVERIYQVHVKGVSVVNVPSKEVTRGTRHKGTVSGFKKAIVTIASGEAIDLFKE